MHNQRSLNIQDGVAIPCCQQLEQLDINKLFKSELLATSIV